MLHEWCAYGARCHLGVVGQSSLGASVFSHLNSKYINEFRNLYLLPSQQGKSHLLWDNIFCLFALQRVFFLEFMSYLPQILVDVEFRDGEGVSPYNILHGNNSNTQVLGIFFGGNRLPIITGDLCTSLQQTQSPADLGCFARGTCEEVEAPQSPDAVRCMVCEDFGASSGSATSHISPVIFK